MASKLSEVQCIKLVGEQQLQPQAQGRCWGTDAAGNIVELGRRVGRELAAVSAAPPAHGSAAKPCGTGPFAALTPETAAAGNIATHEN